MLEMKNIGKVFSRGNLLREKHEVINDVSLYIGKGETLGLIGESGSGKSTLAKLMLRLLEPTSGQLLFDGTDITHASGHELKEFRTRMQIVFQHPQSSLHPKMKIYDLIREPLRLHKVVDKSREGEVVEEMLFRVGLDTGILNRYPAEISGGEIQRVVLARVLALEPEFIVLDEPTSMLDVSVQANMLHLIRDVQQRVDMSYLLITHDTRIVQKFCQKVAVMDHGRIIEEGAVSDVLDSPRHAYTKELIESSVELSWPDKRRNGEGIMGGNRT